VADIELAIEIAAPSSRVWRALCVPTEVGAWDSGVEAALDAPPDYPQPGQHVRWRCRTGFFRILHDRPQEVVPEQTLHSLLSLGFVRYDETYTLTPTQTGTRLAVTLDVSLVPAVGLVVSRLNAIADARLAFETSLANIKRHCETT
jgi:uncharacterized protein YndB with AHSA1/START domain